jgi:hypothetical protein
LKIGDSRRHEELLERPLLNGSKWRNRPAAAGRDFLIERPVQSSHRPFAGVKMEIDRRRNLSFAFAPWQDCY